MQARQRTAAAVALAVLATLLVWWGANTGEPLLTPPSGTLDPFADPPEPLPTPSEDVVEGAEAVMERGDDAPLDVSWLLYVGVAVVLAAIAMLLRALLRPLGAVDQPPEPGDDLALDQLVEATAQPSQDEALAQREPRDAVVACWVAVEDGVERAGLERSPAETSEDLTRRVLGQWQVDQGAIARLAGLYREARFSRHAMTEPDRAAALAALERINTDLRSAARARDEAAAGDLPAPQAQPADDGDAR